MFFSLFYIFHTVVKSKITIIHHCEKLQSVWEQAHQNVAIHACECSNIQLTRVHGDLQILIFKHHM